ncbi:MAG: CoA transferase [Burkholderiales bacterium]|jgi:crotonobetainyl-CoA:carnitine CoA-transferase CaiB-like acyl-CoA transferase|nr:CoA transferase [Burkholderiales bacterium]
MPDDTTPSDNPAGPLAGIRVLEMGSTVAGPFCGRLLADFGAEVIKVETAEGDPVRTMGKRFHGKSLYAASIFRNKSLICLDLRQARGQELAADLAARCDVLVENFRPGSLERWGLGYEALAARNPGLVMVRISGFGQDGPYSQRAGYGVIGEAVSGLRHLTGDPDRPPARVAVSMTDYITGLYGAFGAVLALFARSRSGRGQQIDSALYECAFSFMEPWIPAYQKTGHVANRCGSRLPESTPNNLYPTGDASFIHITAMGDAVFRRLVQAMGQAQLADDPRFASARARSEHQEDIDDLIARWTATQPLATLETVLEAAGVPATRIFTIADIFGDPHYRARGSIVDAPDAELGTVAMANVVPRLSATPGAVRHAGHAVGEDTHRVLHELLGLDAATLQALERDGVIAGRTAAATVTP